MIRPALHYRWCCGPDRKQRGLAIANNLSGRPVDADPTEDVEALRATIAEWGDMACAAMGVTREHAAEVTGSFRRFIGRVDDHLQAHPFLLGERPSLPDIALAGSVKAHFGTDPTPGRCSRTTFPLSSITCGASGRGTGGRWSGPNPVWFPTP